MGWDGMVWWCLDEEWREEGGGGRSDGIWDPCLEFL